MKSQTGLSEEPSSVLHFHPLVLSSSERLVSRPFDTGVATVRFPLHVFVPDEWWFWRKHLMLLPLSSRMPLEGEAGDEVAEVDMTEPEIHRVGVGFQPVVAVTRCCQLGAGDVSWQASRSACPSSLAAVGVSATRRCPTETLTMRKP